MHAHAITMLGTGLIGDFYTNTLHSQRGRDRVRVVYSRSETRAEAFRQRLDIPNHLHEDAVGLIAATGKAVLCTKPLGRNADEARRMLEGVEKAGIFAGYLEDLC